ncbi:Uncharacterized protein TCM_004736 [Theobroma cacao]|uniref:Uncharacterized protein n=1 Tax=Theobroma cacao TaxID=3641 RepID=A0A061DR77_THECC|nr:Uncharacterized protein TCM_004736 [Theobroma cacao]
MVILTSVFDLEWVARSNQTVMQSLLEVRCGTQFGQGPNPRPRVPKIVKMSRLLPVSCKRGLYLLLFNSESVF